MYVLPLRKQKIKNMKKIILLALLVAGLSSCRPGTGLGQKTILVITSVEDTGDQAAKEPYGKYRYQFNGVDLRVYSDSIYSIGDTLKIVK